MSKTDYAAFKQDLFKLQTDLEEDIEAAFENQDLEDGASDLKLIKEMLEEKFILPAGKLLFSLISFSLLLFVGITLFQKFSHLPFFFRQELRCSS